MALNFTLSGKVNILKMNVISRLIYIMRGSPAIDLINIFRNRKFLWGSLFVALIFREKNETAF